MIILLVGIIGAAFLVFAWIFEAAEAVKRHKSLVDLRFAFIYLVGVSVIDIYSWLIQDIVFICLNSILIAAIVTEIVYSIHVKKVHKNR